MFFNNLFEHAKTDTYNQLILGMIEYEPNQRFNVNLTNKKLYHFKTKKQFLEEFDFNKGIFLGKGTYGTVRKCISKINNKPYAIKYVE